MLVVHGRRRYAGFQADLATLDVHLQRQLRLLDRRAVAGPLHLHVQQQVFRQILHTVESIVFRFGIGRPSVVHRPHQPRRQGVALAFIQRIIQLTQHIRQLLALVFALHQMAHPVGHGLIRCPIRGGIAQGEQLFDQRHIGARGSQQRKGVVQTQQAGCGVEIGLAIAYGWVGTDQGLQFTGRPVRDPAQCLDFGLEIGIVIRHILQVGDQLFLFTVAAPRNQVTEIHQGA